MSSRLPPPTDDRRTLLDLIERNVATLGDRPMATDAGTTHTWRQYGDITDALALGFHELGVRPGDVVGIHQRNRFEHVLADTAAVKLGATPVSVYNTLSSEQLEFIVTDTDMRLLVVEAALLGNWLPILPALPNLAHIIVIDGPADGDRMLTWNDALERGRRILSDGDPTPIIEARKAVQADDIATIVYTSGTTGPPKGVLLPHGRMRFTLDMVTDHFRRQVALAADTGLATDRDDPTASESRLICYLPLAHAAERFASYYLALQWGSHIHYVRELDQLAVVLPAVQPSFVLAVPRVWEKFGSGMASKVSEPGAKAKLGKAALDTAREMGEHRMSGTPPRPGLRLKHRLFEKALYPKMRHAMGLGRSALALSGAAPIDTSLLCLFSGLGVPIIEGYGMTESGGIATFSSLDRLKPGSVGTVFHPEVEVAIADDGEILIRGPHITPGYHNRPEATAEAIDAEGWLQTGDLGQLDPDGSLRVTGRKKEIIINSAGKNMSPDAIETSIKRESFLISHVVAIGDRRNYNTALIVLDPDALAKWAANHGVSALHADLAADPRIRAEIERAVSAGNERLSRVEQVKRFEIIDEPWTPESPEMTPTMKLRRSVIAERHAAVIESMYEVPSART